jgi:hypothetical protein
MLLTICKLPFPEKPTRFWRRAKPLAETWDLFRYPGVRSDSDMHTLGFPFRPWHADEAIAGGPAIWNYIRETATHYGIGRLWSELASGGVTFPRWSRDSKYIYWDGRGEDAFISRVRIADHVLEPVASLKDMRKTGALGSWAGSAPDGSPLILRYANSEEIYALDLNLP